MKTIFSRGLGQFNWNSYGGNPGANPYSWNTSASGLTPEQNLLQQNAAAGSGAPQSPGTMPGEIAAGGNCFTCSNGGPSQDVDAATAASLKKQGYVCYPCQQRGGGMPGGLSNFSGFSEGAMPAQSMVDQGAFGGESFGGGASMFPGGGSMMGGRQVRLVLPRRPF